MSRARSRRLSKPHGCTTWATCIASSLTGTGRWSARTARKSTNGSGSASRLHVSPSFLGMVRVDGDLDPEKGETVLTAIRAVLDVETKFSDRRDDRRTAAHRRADALGEVCRQWLDGRDRPLVAGERPHMTIETVSADALQGSAPELDDACPISPRSRDARVRRGHHASRAVRAFQPLDVGRRTPVVSPAIRRAVIALDRTCPFPGVTAPRLVRRPPRRALGRRRPDRCPEPAAAVPPAPSEGARARRIQA